MLHKSLKSELFTGRKWRPRYFICSDSHYHIIQQSFFSLIYPIYFFYVVFSQNTNITKPFCWWRTFKGFPLPSCCSLTFSASVRALHIFLYPDFFPTNPQYSPFSLPFTPSIRYEAYRVFLMYFLLCGGTAHLLLLLPVSDSSSRTSLALFM